MSRLRLLFVHTSRRTHTVPGFWWQPMGSLWTCNTAGNPKHRQKYYRDFDVCTQPISVLYYDTIRQCRVYLTICAAGILLHVRVNCIIRDVILSLSWFVHNVQNYGRKLGSARNLNCHVCTSEHDSSNSRAWQNACCQAFLPNLRQVLGLSFTYFDCKDSKLNDAVLIGDAMWQCELFVWSGWHLKSNVQ